MTPHALLWVFMLWVMLHICFVTPAKPGMGQKDKIAGRTAPMKLIGDLPDSSNFSTAAVKKFPGKVLRALLKDQLGVDEPEKGPVYVFLNFWPGALYEDVFNGGKHVTIIFASWGADDAMDFRGQGHHLAIEECENAIHNAFVFDFDEALNCLKHNNRFRALGKSEAGANFDEVISQGNKSSMAYFQQNKDYNYLLSNCGDYVQAMVDLTRPEFGKIEVPLAPPTIRV